MARTILAFVAGLGALGALVVHVLALLDFEPATLQLPATALFLTVFPALVGTVAVLRVRRERSGEPLAISALFERTPIALRVALGLLAIYVFATFVNLVVIDDMDAENWFSSDQVGRDAQRTFARVSSALTLLFDLFCLTALVGAERERVE